MVETIQYYVIQNTESGEYAMGEEMDTGPIHKAHVWDTYRQAKFAITGDDEKVIEVIAVFHPSKYTKERNERYVIKFTEADMYLTKMYDTNFDNTRFQNEAITWIKKENAEAALMKLKNFTDDSVRTYIRLWCPEVVNIL